ncbi:hypothetical protein SDC9_188485 [bioreactor metagenome]|uniref:Uncharacterized protein n=1 Tax=bioreactor metagenome TaxID=1076179 RepID=A0A645HPF7_9ZZZZ
MGENVATLFKSIVKGKPEPAAEGHFADSLGHTARCDGPCGRDVFAVFRNGI